MGDRRDGNLTGGLERDVVGWDFDERSLDEDGIGSRFRSGCKRETMYYR